MVASCSLVSELTTRTRRLCGRGSAGGHLPGDPGRISLGRSGSSIKLTSGSRFEFERPPTAS